MLFVASVMGMYWELLFIRWLPSAVHVLGFFANLVLLSCFTGMGIGVARHRTGGDTPARCLRRLGALSLATCLLVLFKVQAVVPRDAHNLNEVSASHIEARLALWLILPAVYAAVLYAFVPLGEWVGETLLDLPPLRAYAINIGGGVVGVAVFTALSFLCTSPTVWLLLGVAGLVAACSGRRSHAAWLILPLLVAGTYGLESRLNQWTNLWTPYYNLKVMDRPADDQGRPGGFAALVGNFFLLSGAPVTRDPASEVYELYSLPYQYASARRVLVLGAGGGNDVAMALAMGAQQVDAVEIDPTVLKLGETRNPEHPYADGRVRVFNQDARRFLRHTDGQYDLIIFGTLDSHGLFSALSSLKMENFVYTREAFEDARRHLTPQGLVAVTVGFDEAWVGLRLRHVLETVFGTPVYMHRGISSLVTLVAGPALQGVSPVELPRYRPVDAGGTDPAASLTPTDDWPYLFSYRAEVPLPYLAIGALLALISLGTVRRLSPPAVRPSAHFFFLGAAFLLLEMRTITELALAFGSTWITSAVVITVILLLLLAATLLCNRLPSRMPLGLPYGLLLLSLLGSWWVPHGGLDLATPWQQWGMGLLSFGLPIFLAAIIFGTSFARTRDVPGAFASNLLGAVLGGLLEYASMALGFAALSLVAAALYAISWYRLGREV